MLVPYRDSKLTCLLKQSLGGNSFCCMIACLHPSDRYFEENQSTLTYASKAAQIANTPVKNDDPKTKIIEELKVQNKQLTQELMRANYYIQMTNQGSGHRPEVFGEGFLKPQNKNLPSLRTLKSDNMDLEDEMEGMNKSAALKKTKS